jgi:cysteine desulfurase
VLDAHAVLYFDHNATSPLCAPAREAWLDATERFIGNPSSPHRLGARAEAALEEARAMLAGWLGCKADEIVWTSGATESVNTAIHHTARASEREAWVSAIEHPCVLSAAEHHFGGRLRTIPVNKQGVLDLAWLDAALATSRPALIAVMAANNETGVLQPWREVLALCKEREVPLLCDAAQWVGKMPAQGLGGCDFVSGCAHKFGGPQGVGFLKTSARLKPLLFGGLQEEGRRAGTENVASILSMVAALEAREAAMCQSLGAKQDLRPNFEREVRLQVSGARIVGSGAERLWNTCTVIMPEVGDCRHRWVVKLDKLGFAVSTGSACASGKEAPSHVLAAMGVSAADSSRVLRFSSGWETTMSDWGALLDGLVRAHGEMRG